VKEDLGTPALLEQCIRTVRPYPPRGSAGPVVTSGAGLAHSPWTAACTRASIMPAVLGADPVLGGRGLSPRSSGTGSRRNRPRVSRRDDHSGRPRPPSSGNQRVSEPRSFLSTTRTTRRLRRWAPEPARPGQRLGTNPRAFSRRKARRRRRAFAAASASSRR
jgi:hypothetical protein